MTTPKKPLRTIQIEDFTLSMWPTSKGDPHLFLGCTSDPTISSSRQKQKLIITPAQLPFLKQLIATWEEAVAAGPVIIAARITDLPQTLSDALPKVIVRFEEQNDEVELFEFFPDEISFTAREFLGLTEAQARQLKSTKDLAYLSS